MIKRFIKSGIDVAVETKKTITIALSQDRAECILHQLDEVCTGYLGSDWDRGGDLGDFVQILEESLR